MTYLSYKEIQSVTVGEVNWEQIEEVLEFKYYLTLCSNNNGGNNTSENNESSYSNNSNNSSNSSTDSSRNLTSHMPLDLLTGFNIQLAVFPKLRCSNGFIQVPEFIEFEFILLPETLLALVGI